MQPDLANAQTVFIKSHGLLFPHDPSITRSRIRRQLRQGGYEQREFIAARSVLKKDDVVLELGGGIGFMSTVASKICGVQSVHIYEANPALIPYITSVHQHNGVRNATIIHALLGPKKAEAVDFYVRDDFLASSLDPMQGDSDGGVTSVEKVPVHGIQKVLDTLKPTALICDIEGAEAQLLPHADLSCLQSAVVELHPQWIKQDGVQKVFDTMHRAGLTYFPRTSNKKVVTFRKGW